MERVKTMDEVVGKIAFAIVNSLEFIFTTKEGPFSVSTLASEVDVLTAEAFGLQTSISKSLKIPPAQWETIIVLTLGDLERSEHVVKSASGLWEISPEQKRQATLNRQLHDFITTLYALVERDQATVN